jgi:iron complex transport system substrate-binding protein
MATRQAGVRLVVPRVGDAVRRVRASTAAVSILLTLAAAGVAPLAGSRAPQRIVSLIPAVTEMLFALGAGDRVIAVSSFDTYPPEVQKLQRVGALLDPDLERILSLRPDLVVVYGTQMELREQLERAGVPMFIYSHAGLADVTTTISTLGERIDASEKAAKLVQAIERRILSVKQRTIGKPRPRTLIVFGRDSLALRGIYASGGIGFVHDMVTAAGGENVFSDVRQQSLQATAELIIARRPEVILELRAEPLDPETERLERAVWNTLASVPAVRTGRVHILTDRRTVIPGPRVGEGVEAIARALHGR